MQNNNIIALSWQCQNSSTRAGSTCMIFGKRSDQKGTYLVMGTISAVNAVIEGMTPVTNMDDSIHGTFWCSSPKMKQCPMSYQLLLHFFKKRAPVPVPFPSENETHRASSSLVAIKLSNIKVGCEAPGMLNYNLDIICAVQLRSSVKCISLFAQKRWKGGWLTSDETCIKWKEACSLSEWQSYKDSSNF